ncbi:MAG: monovalent cation:proton antiporter-2 (CPA2) family protein [Gammaproteobacteria bacterium]|nr:monovalent cation:proton antiporter-2 (CPA2) family protein [Gammaproteobacteria bacterium]
MEAALQNVLIFLIAAVAVVPLAKRLRLGTVLGYLLAGLLIGPWGLKLILDAEVILHFAEFGVVLLLFLIGLELNPRRLWDMRRAILGAGASQLLVSALPLAGLALLAGLGAGSALVVGYVLALSSTPFALQIIAERHWGGTATGKTAFSILLFQDIAVIPLLAVVPLLGEQGGTLEGGAVALGIGRALLILAAILVIGPRVARPLFRLVALTGSRELFTALSLLIVIALALLVSIAGMSMAMGAFLGGVLLAESEYRHELEVDLEPFKGLLMGLFFMAVGMSIDVGGFGEAPLRIIGATLAVLTVKFVALVLLGRRLGLGSHQALQLGALLCQGGEFGFVVFAAAAGVGVLPQALVEQLTVVIVLSMVLTPLVLAGVETWVARRLARRPTREVELVEIPEQPVVIAGFGRFGQIVARLLNANNIGTTVVERDPDQIELLRRFGHEVHYGDATRLDLLRAAGVEHARMLIVAIDDPEATLRVVDLAREHFPTVPLLVRVRNRSQAYDMLDRGITNFERETFAAAVNVGVRALKTLGFDAERARHAGELFQVHDETTLVELHAVRGDQGKVISLVTTARSDLERLMQAEEGEPVAADAATVD